MLNRATPHSLTRALRAFLLPGIAALLVFTGCSEPTTEAPDSLTAADRIAPEINITCAEFNKLGAEDQKEATDRLLRHYDEATELASAYADARQDSANNQKNLTGDLQLGDPSSSPWPATLVRSPPTKMCGSYRHGFAG